MESAACGYLVALALHARLTGREFVPPPATTALGSLYRHVTGEAHPPDYPHQPTNVIFGLFPPLPGRVKKQDKRARYSARAQAGPGHVAAATACRRRRPTTDATEERMMQLRRLVVVGALVALSAVGCKRGDSGGEAAAGGARAAAPGAAKGAGVGGDGDAAGAGRRRRTCA